MQGLEDRFAPPEHFTDAFDRAHEQAAAKAGTDDFGPDDYQEGLRILLMSLDYDARFHERGRAIAWGSVVGALYSRAFATRAMQERPGFDAAPIRAPIVITGIPRTGTTALHKLLAVDPQFQGLQGWLLATPMPRPPRATWDDNPLFQDAVERLALRFAADPTKRAAHDMAADEVDECCGLLRQAFVSNLWCASMPTPSYDLWWQTQSEGPAYRWYENCLKLIGANEPGKRWLLKNPGHVDNLDQLFAIFPDARVIQTHRDPARAVPSLCSLMIANYHLMEDCRPKERARMMGVREAEKWARAIRRAEPIRCERADQFLDIDHGDFHGDPMEAVEKIYVFAGAELTAPVRAAMERRIAEKPEAAFGVHRYDIADYGMTAEAIRERFGDYVDRFNLVRDEAA